MNIEDIDKIKQAKKKLDINSEEDRKIFEQDYLYPALKLIYSGILGKITPIIIGSVSLYLQGIYLDEFPNDIDIRFENCEHTFAYNMLYSRMCLKYGFNIEFLSYKSEEFFNDINILYIDDIKIYTTKIEEVILFYDHYRDLWASKGKRKKSL